MAIRGGNLYIGQDNLVEWGSVDEQGTGLYDNNLGSFDNSATVTFTLYQSDGTSAVSGGSGTCSYITGSQGCYRGTLEDGVSLTSGTTYILEVLATGSGDRIGRRRISYVARYMGAD